MWCCLPMNLKSVSADYAVAYNNKAQALRIAAEEKARQEADILEQQQQAQMAVKIESAAVTETPICLPLRRLKRLMR